MKFDVLLIEIKTVHKKTSANNKLDEKLNWVNEKFEFRKMLSNKYPKETNGKWNKNIIIPYGKDLELPPDSKKLVHGSNEKSDILYTMNGVKYWDCINGTKNIIARTFIVNPNLKNGFLNNKIKFRPNVLGFLYIQRRYWYCYHSIVF